MNIISLNPLNLFFFILHWSLPLNRGMKNLILRRRTNHSQHLISDILHYFVITVPPFTITNTYFCPGSMLGWKDWMNSPCTFSTVSTCLARTMSALLAKDRKSDIICLDRRYGWLVARTGQHTRSAEIQYTVHYTCQGKVCIDKYCVLYNDKL